MRLLSRAVPGCFWRAHSWRARRLGLNRLYVILSFDCDTPEDAEAALAIDADLRRHGIKATYAVPGAVLKCAPEAYRRLADGGADFLNHGARPHAEYREGRYWSVTFYNEMAPEEMEEDIRQGHEIVSRIIGKPPRGFRAPHFGTFQRPDQLALQYRVLTDLGYLYSTSTVPWFGFRYGPVWKAGRIFEVPLSGSRSRPLKVLDSWGQVVSPYLPRIRPGYASAFTETMEYFISRGLPGLLNYYVDPVHVAYPSSPFEAVVDGMVKWGVPSLHYGDLFSLIGVSPG